MLQRFKPVWVGKERAQAKNWCTSCFHEENRGKENLKREHWTHCHSYAFLHGKNMPLGIHLFWVIFLITSSIFPRVSQTRQTDSTWGRGLFTRMANKPWFWSHILQLASSNNGKNNNSVHSTFINTTIQRVQIYNYFVLGLGQYIL